MVASLAGSKQSGEKAGLDIHVALSNSEATALHEDAKESLYDALHRADEPGLAEEAEPLRKRQNRIKALLISQFGC